MSEQQQDFTSLAESQVEIEAFGVPGTLGQWAAPPANPPSLRMAHEALMLGICFFT